MYAYTGDFDITVCITSHLGWGLWQVDYSGERVTVRPEQLAGFFLKRMVGYAAKAAVSAAYRSKNAAPAASLPEGVTAGDLGAVGLAVRSI